MIGAEKQKSAGSHAEYINRENAYEHRGGCIFHDHHLPKWAHNDLKKFFHAADKYEAKTWKLNLPCLTN